MNKGIFAGLAAGVCVMGMVGVASADIQLKPGMPLIFLDDTAIAMKPNVYRVVHQGKEDAKPILEQPAKWEEDAKGRGQLCIYGSVYPKDDGSGYRMWYNNFGRVNYAESVNGVDWTKPLLGAVPIGSDKGQNNITMAWLACPSIIDDKFEKDPQKRFKMVGCRYASDRNPENPTRGYYSATSPDGIHWSAPKRFIKHWWDTCTLAQNPYTGEILFYHKHEIMHKGFYRRTVWLSRTMDFENWSEPEFVFSADEEDDAEYREGPEQSTDIYLFSVVPHAGGFMGIPSIFRMTELLRTVDKDRAMSGHNGPLFLGLATSPDGKTWSRLPGRKPLLPNRTKGEYNYGHPGCSSGGAFLHVGEESWLYTYCSSHNHGDGYPVDWKRGDPTGWSIGRAVWRRWGFVSLEAKAGTVTTKPMRLETPNLTLNVGGIKDRPLSDARVKVLVRNAAGRLIAADTVPAGSTRQKPNFYGRLPVGEPITFTFELTRAALYSIEVE